MYVYVRVAYMWESLFRVQLLVSSCLSPCLVCTLMMQTSMTRFSFAGQFWSSRAHKPFNKRSTDLRQVYLCLKSNRFTPSQMFREPLAAEPRMSTFWSITPSTQCAVFPESVIQIYNDNCFTRLYIKQSSQVSGNFEIRYFARKPYLPVRFQL